MTVASSSPPSRLPPAPRRGSDIETQICAKPEERVTTGPPWPSSSPPPCQLLGLICGGLQDNGSWCGPSATRSGNGILNSDWFRVGGGDGFYTQNDQSDWTSCIRNRRTARRTASNSAPGAATASARADPAGRARKRACWWRNADPAAQAPPLSLVFRRQPEWQHRPGASAEHLLSVLLEHAVHPLTSQSATVYLGGDRLFRSYDRGETWMASPDLTKNIGGTIGRSSASPARSPWLPSTTARLRQQYRDDRRIAARARHHLGRNQRRQPSGQS